MADPLTAVTVAIPVRDGARTLPGVLAALQQQTAAHELLICDSGSRDGSMELARGHGARIIGIAPEEFGHGRTRNLLMGEASGAHVAFLTQDAEPAGPQWLERLLSGFALAENTGLVYGPYLARPDAPFAVRSELARWFGSLSPDGSSVAERLDPDEREHPERLLLGRRGFFTDANGCVSKQAWERVRYRDIAFAEDRALALDMMVAGFAKCYVPEAGVLHSHHYGPLQELRRGFDEGRALREVYGWREPVAPRHVLGRLRGEVGASLSELRAAGAPAPSAAATLAAVTTKQIMRTAGAQLGSRAEALPPALRRRLSLERRDDAPATAAEATERKLELGA